MNQRVNPEKLIDGEKLWQDNRQAFQFMLSRGLLNDFDRLPAEYFRMAPPPCFYWGEMGYDEAQVFDRSVLQHQWVTRKMVETGQVMVCSGSNEPEGMSPALRALAHALDWLELSHSDIHPEHWLMKYIVDLEVDCDETTVGFSAKASAPFDTDGREFMVHVADSVKVSWREHEFTFTTDAALSWFQDDGFRGELVVVGAPDPYEVARILSDYYDHGEPERACWEYAGEQLGLLLDSLCGATAAESVASVVNGAGLSLLPNVDGSLTLVSIKDDKVQTLDASALHEVARLLRQEGDNTAAIVAALRPLVEALPA